MAGGKDKRRNHLTGKQEAFAKLVAVGDMPQYAAYAEAGYATNSVLDIIIRRASELAATSDVSDRIRELRDKAAGPAVKGLEGRLVEMQALGNKAGEAGQHNAAIRAAELGGKLEGEYVERLRTETADPKAALAELCAGSPELKALLWPIIFGEDPPLDEEQPVTH